MKEDNFPHKICLISEIPTSVKQANLARTDHKLVKGVGTPFVTICVKNTKIKGGSLQKYNIAKIN